MQWPADSADALATLARARVVDVDSSEGAGGGVEFPHRSLQEYFAAVATVDLLSGTGGVAPSLPVDDSFDSGGVPAEDDTATPEGRQAMALEVFFSTLATPELRATVRAKLLGLYEGGGVPLIGALISLRREAGARASRADAPEIIIKALCDPANDVLRLLAVALSPGDSPDVTDSIVEALRAGSKSPATFVDQLSRCVRESPCAPRLACRQLFDDVAVAFWEQRPRVDTVQLLGHQFWVVADTVSGGAQARRALAALGVFATPCNFLRSGLEPAVAAAQIIGGLTRLATPSDLADALAALRLASASSAKSLAAEAVFALAMLDQPALAEKKGSSGGLRQRLLELALRTNAADAAAVVPRAALELANRYAGDRVVEATLLRLATGTTPSPFVMACVTGPGVRLVSLEVAVALFKTPWLDETSRVQLASRLWSRTWSRGHDYSHEYGYTPLHVAAACGRADFITLLANQDRITAKLVNARLTSGETPLHLAVSHGHLACVIALLAIPAVDAAALDNKKRTPLNTTSGRGESYDYAASAAIVSALLEVPVAAEAVDSPDADGWTPLHNAAFYGKAAIVELLLRSHRADVNARTLRQRPPRQANSTPLHLALPWSEHAVVSTASKERLLRALLAAPGVDANIRNAEGLTPLHCAAQTQRTERACVEVFLGARNLDANAKSPAGQTALHVAISRGNREVFDALLGPRGRAARVDVNARDSSGRTPLAHARAEGKPLWVDQLAAMGGVA